MAISYFRWIKTSSADYVTAIEAERKQIRSHYLQNNILCESRSAVWLFRMDLGYKPGSGIISDRTLVRVEFTPDGESIMESPDNHIDFENPAFKGEAQHPLKIIIKNNEPGARGVGCKILEFLNARIRTIVLATNKEISKATN